MSAETTQIVGIMAAVATQLAPALPLPIFDPIIEQAAGPKATAQVTQFDPKKHLANAPLPDVILMKDIGYPEDTGVSPVAVCQPFQLFSHEAVQQMRSEIFKPEVHKDCSYSSNIAQCQLRGYAPKYAPFAYDAWTHPDTLAIISKIAGVDLVPEMDFEIGHINFSVKTEEEANKENAAIDKKKRALATDDDDDMPIVGWHRDSYPFVCVLMLSDCTSMVGGETALRTADGNVIRVRGPQEGCAVILQGRYITHQALRALGGKERITSVTSFRPRSYFAKDDTVLTTVRPISDLSELYYQFAQYRMEMMEERFRRGRKELSVRHNAGKKLDIAALKQFFNETIAFLQHTQDEIVDEDKVTPGYIEEMDIPNVVVGDGKVTKRGRFQ